MLFRSLADDVRRVHARGEMSGAAAAAAEVADGQALVLVESPPAAGPHWLAHQLRALERAYLAVRATRTGSGVAATSLAIRRDDLLVRGTLAPGPHGLELTKLWSDVQADGRPVQVLAA